MRKSRTLIPICAFSLLLSACGFDMGVFGDKDEYKSYYETFGDLKGIVGKEEDYSYDLKDSLFNSTTINKFSWEKDDYVVKEKPYVYLTLQVKKELKIEGIALYLKAPAASSIVLSTYYFPTSSSAPKQDKIKYKDSPDEDEHGDPIQYDDPSKDLSICNATISANAGEWIDFGLSSFHQEGYTDNYLHTAENSYIYVRIENNSGLNKEMTSVSFSFINLIIRAV